MGKKKIEIAKIDDKEKRKVTFTKRRQGLFKKAADTCLECGGEIAVIAFSEVGNVFSFSNTSVDSVIDHYMDGVEVEEEEKEERHAHKKRKLTDDAGFWWEHIDPSTLDYERLSYLRNVLMGLKDNVRKRLEELTSSSSHMVAATPAPLLSSSFMAAKPVEYSATLAASTSFDILTASTSFDIPTASTSFDIHAASTTFNVPASSSSTSATDFTANKMEEEDQLLFLTEEDQSLFLTEEDFSFLANEAESTTPVASTDIASTCFDIPAASSATNATSFTAIEMGEEEDHSPFFTEEDFSFLANDAESSTPAAAASTDIASTCFDIPAASSATNATSFTAIEMGEEEEDHLLFLTEEDFSFLANEDEFPLITERDDFLFLEEENDFRWPLKDDVSDIDNIFNEADEEGQQLASLLCDIQRQLHE